MSKHRQHISLGCRIRVRVLYEKLRIATHIDQSIDTEIDR
jgi:hypothetical protein